jgi:glycosyltransferase involved in cell wall biosynthesis
MIYTAHGFHFFKGAPLLNWLIFCPMEWFCSWYTDVLITINREDYAFAQAKLKAKQVIYVPGIGVDLEKFRIDEKTLVPLRRELELRNDEIVLLTVGELCTGKNHELVLRALAKLQCKNVRFLICGLGVLKDQLLALTEELGLQNQVTLLGYRSDIPRILGVSDIFVFPSVREGLSVALMESMAAGKAVACSRIRGNTDLIEKDGGVLFDPVNVEECAKAIRSLLDADYKQMGRFNAEKIKGFSREAVEKQMFEIYGCVL